MIKAGCDFDRNLNIFGIVMNFKTDMNKLKLV